MQNKKIKLNNNGFSMLEAVISVFVIATGLVAVILLMSSGLRESIGSRDQMVAVLLAQEGTEIVRNIRDNNWAANPKRDSFGNLPDPNKSDCRVDGDFLEIKNGDCNKNNSELTLGYKNRRYVVDSSATATKFKRKINFDYDAGKNSLIVESMVVWGRSDFPNNCTTSDRCVTAQVMLTTWGK